MSRVWNPETQQVEYRAGPSRDWYGIGQAARHWGLPPACVSQAIRRGDCPGVGHDEHGLPRIAGEVVEAATPSPSGQSGYGWLHGSAVRPRPG